MAKILINDGISSNAIEMLEKAGHIVSTTKIPQDQLSSELPKYDAICVRSATKIRQDLIDQCPNLRVIGRGGVGLDNIDVEYAKSKGVKVINTPAASSRSVAELTIGHLFILTRHLAKANRAMPCQGNTAFKDLKKQYSKGQELQGKTIGIIGFGRIGREVAKIALGIGLNVICFDPMTKNTTVNLAIANNNFEIEVPSLTLNSLITQADYITCHTPGIGKSIIGDQEINTMKDGVILLNASRGGIIDEDALLKGLESGKVASAGLDVFVNEPQPREDILAHPNISLSPHIGASTLEAQNNIGEELAAQLIDLLP